MKYLLKKISKYVYPQYFNHCKSILDKETQKKISCVQNTILQNIPDSYYTVYSKSETSYWAHIPGWILQKTPNNRNINVLDVGSAYGTLSVFTKKYFPMSNVYAVDFMDCFCPKNLFNKLKINFALNNFETDQIPWNIKFDVIIFTEILEHFNFHPVDALKKISLLLKDSGILYLTTPDAKEWGKTTKYYKELSNIPTVHNALNKVNNQKNKLDIVDAHIWHYSVEELLHVLYESKLIPIEFQYSPGYNARHFNLAIKKKI
jgi:2-polyprenyl-3-methyl-5-hydroxy-6-metoxy-1,4-benzoquinol methylase